MQFIKKVCTTSHLDTAIYNNKSSLFLNTVFTIFIQELLNALVAMDELMGSNEMNMQIAAMTPAVILLMAVRRTFLFLFYSIFREGRSRDDVYGKILLFVYNCLRYESTLRYALR